jgi:hypothetical protein
MFQELETKHRIESGFCTEFFDRPCFELELRISLSGFPDGEFRQVYAFDLRATPVQQVAEFSCGAANLKTPLALRLPEGGNRLEPNLSGLEGLLAGAIAEIVSITCSWYLAGILEIALLVKA